MMYHICFITVLRHFCLSHFSILFFLALNMISRVSVSATFSNMNIQLPRYYLSGDWGWQKSLEKGRSLVLLAWKHTFDWDIALSVPEREQSAWLSTGAAGCRKIGPREWVQRNRAHAPRDLRGWRHQHRTCQRFGMEPTFYVESEDTRLRHLLFSYHKGQTHCHNYETIL